MDGSAQTPTPRKPSSVRFLVFAFLGILLFLWIAFWLHYFEVIYLGEQFPFLPTKTQQVQVPTPTPAMSVLPTPVGPTVKGLESCAVTKERNALVEDVRTIDVEGKGIVVGRFRGNINKVTFNETKTTAAVEVISPRGEQTHTFNLKEEDGLVYDMTTGKDGKLVDLSPGQVVTMSFNCFPSQPASEQFKITRVTITGRL